MIKIYYYKPEYSRDMVMGVEFLKENDLLPDTNNIEKTHILLNDTLEYDSLDEIDYEFNGTGTLENIYSMYQGENWSPNGEARELILSKGLNHTSMSMGDIIQVDDEFYMVDTFGFTEITNYELSMDDETRLMQSDRAYLGE